MLLLKYLLLALSAGLFAATAVMVATRVHRLLLRRQVPDGGEPTTFVKPEWGLPLRTLAFAWVVLAMSVTIVVVPAGMAGVRVSQISGTLPTTLYPGTHLQLPFVHRTHTYDVREQVFTTGAEPAVKQAKDAPAEQREGLKVQAREGMSIGLAITVRYRLDAARLAHLNANLPHPVEREIVPAVIAAAFRDLTPQYTVREVFSEKREEVQRRAADEIKRKLGADGIRVREVMVRDIQLPPEYAKAMEALLLKEQENVALNYETEIRQKQVRIAELEAEAQKAREVKHAEAEAQMRVLQAKGESDAMQFLLPLKEKQIRQSRLEAEARKEATVKNAEAAAEAKVIDSKAELARRNFLSEAEAHRIRLTAAADAERMKGEAQVLKQNPLLINKIIAERLSDKVQIMMVPTDGRFFFNDVLRSALPRNPALQAEDAEQAPKEE